MFLMNIMVLSSYKFITCIFAKITHCYKVLLVWISFIPCNRMLFFARCLNYIYWKLLIHLQITVLLKLRLKKYRYVFSRTYCLILSITNTGSALMEFLLRTYKILSWCANTILARISDWLCLKYFQWSADWVMPSLKYQFIFSWVF